MRRPRYFQWIDGDNEGQVETLVSIGCYDGEYFYNFKSGESCNLRFISKMTTSPADLKGKAMVEIMTPGDRWNSTVISMRKEKVMDPTSGEILVDVPPLEDITGASGSGNELNLDKSSLGKRKYTPPRYRGAMPQLPSYDEWAEELIEAEKQTEQKTARIEATKVEPEVVKPAVIAPKTIEPAKISVVSDTDPVRILAKTCKKHPTEVSLSLEINLPSKSVYNIAKAEFDNGGKNFIDCLVEEIDVTEIVKSISDALYATYEEETEI